jgi:flagellin-like protein
MSKKGITPIIAVILLLMMVVAGAGAAFFWFTRMQSELQGSSDSYQEGLTTTISSRVEVAETDANRTHIDLYLKNTGTKSILLTNSTINAILRESGEEVICAGKLNTHDFHCIKGCNETLSPKKLRKIVISLMNETDGEILSSCGNLSAGTKYNLNLDFGGDAATGTDFSY